VPAAIIGGWQAGGIVTAFTGVPVSSPTTGNLASTGNANSLYGNCTGVSPVPANRDLQHWWNGAAFDNTSSSLTYGPGNCGRDPFYGIGEWTMDLSMSRNIRIRENHKLNVRLDAFNSLNHANYNTPSTNYLSPTTFGIVTSARTMRQLQVSMKSMKYVF
jgi:hypothetical protein